MNRVLIVALAIWAAGCARLPSLSAHRIEIQQGNFVSQEMVAQLKSGMTRDQVKFILGTPLLTDVFHADRWDYVFSRRLANSKELEFRRITVFFEDGRLKRVDGDVVAKGDAQAGTASARGATR